MTLQRPMFPPVDPTRRRLLTVAAASVALAIPTTAQAAGSPPADTDPVFAAIDRFRACAVRYDAVANLRYHCKDFGKLSESEKAEVCRRNDELDEAGLPMEAAAFDLIGTVPTSTAGIVAAIRIIQAYQRDEGPGHMPFAMNDAGEDAPNVSDWHECFLDTLAEAVERLGRAGA